MQKYLVLLLLIVGCASKSNKTMVRINLAANGRSLQISGISNDVLQEISRDSATATTWQGLIPVYRMPKDTGLKDYQSPQPGKYVVTNYGVVFTPDTPFIKRQVYFLRFYKYGDGNSMMGFIQHRKKLGQVAYRDLSFER